MHWQEEAIILSVKPLSEKEALVVLFARTHGLYRTVAKHAFTSRQRGTYQAGNLVFCKWNARLAEQMGTATCELLEPYAALAMQQAATLSALSAMSGLLMLAMHERDPHPALYDRARNVLAALVEGADWPKEYALFERDVLSESGFGLDLSECAATGSREDLIYVSPKTGRAVSAAAGEPYKDKLFPLPTFFLSSPRRGEGLSEILAALRLTGHFLEQWMLAPRDHSMPPARVRLMELLQAVQMKDIA